MLSLRATQTQMPKLGNQPLNYTILVPGFPTGVENTRGGSSRFDGGLESIHGGAWADLKQCS